MFFQLYIFITVTMTGESGHYLNNQYCPDYSIYHHEWTG